MVKPKTRQAEGTAAAGGTDPADVRAARYGKLPARPAMDELVEEAPTEPPEDPQMGRDSDRDWMLRYS